MSTREQHRQELRTGPALLADMLAAPVVEARADLEELDAELWRLEHRATGSRLRVPPTMGMPAPSLNGWVALVLVALGSLVVLFTLGGGERTGLSRWAPFGLGENSSNLAQLSAAVRPPGDYQLQGPPSLTAAQIDRILESYGSPAAGTGELWYNLGLKYGIDPAFAVAFFIHESSAGTNPAWAGIKPGGGTTHNVGNIICAGYPTCYGRFRDYSSWAEGIEDWYRLIDVEYIKGRGTLTVAEIIPIYAPSFENDVQGYINSVHQLVDSWRSEGVR